MDALKLLTILNILEQTGWLIRSSERKKGKKKKRGTNTRAETDATKHEEIHK